MAEGIEAYHVPQQSRRDKLRVVVPTSQNHPAAGCAGFLPMYDPSLISPEMLTCAPPPPPPPHHPHQHQHQHQHQQTSPLSATVHLPAGFAGGRYQYHPYFDSLPPMNPGSLPDIDQNPLLFSPQNHCFSSVNGAFKPEPLSLSLSSQPYLAISGSNNVMSKSLVPLGPFTGYASILKGSRFLKPAQQLLEELCDVGAQGIHTQKPAAESTLVDPPSDSLSESGIIDDPLSCGEIGEGTQGTKSRLVSMLDEVYRRYKQYYQQIQEVMTSFEYISGLGNAAPYANQAIKAMYKHFKCLKNAILDQLQFTKKTHGDNYCQRSVHNSGFLDHQPVWRPQRGLPERAVTVLRAWLFEHFLHPYPSDTDKLMLAKQTGLSRSQVSNWFINARVRLWKPMVEEIYMLETKQAQKNFHREERTGIRSNDPHPSSNSLPSDNPSSSAQPVQDAPSKRTRNEPHEMPLSNQEQPLSVSYNLSNHPQVGANANMAGSNGGVSLTLGLHQNNGVGFSEPFPVGFPVTAPRRFGLGVEANGDGGYVMGSFEGQNRHFGRDVLGGQLLHDFVG